MKKRFDRYLSCLLALLTLFTLLQPPAASWASGTESNPAAQTIWLTEIYPNDIGRNSVYSGLSGSSIDSMDYLEVYNASDAELDFGAAYNLVYTDLSVTDGVYKVFTYNETELIIPAKTPAVFWVRRVDLENKGGEMPDEADFRASTGVPDDVPVFSVNNQAALKNTTAKVDIVAKSNNEFVSTFTYVAADAGAKEGSSVHLQATEGLPGSLSIATQAAPSAGRVSGEQQTFKTKPQLVLGTVSRISESTATVTFTSYEAGVYYYEVVPHGASAPTIDTDTGNGIACEANSPSLITLTALTAEARDIYIVMKDSSNAFSDLLKADIPAYTASASEALWLTEIYPNDIGRNSVYTGLSGATIDSMDYIEVYNASDSELDFGATYNLVYTDLDVAAVVDKVLTFNETELIIPAQTPAVFWVRRVDLENKGKTMPDEADFRASTGVPDGVPVFSVNNQTALRNTTAKVSVIAKSSNEPVSTYTYVTADAGTKEGSSVHLQAAEGLAGNLSIATQAAPSAGQVSEAQKSLKPDPGVTPELTPLFEAGAYDTIAEGTDLSIPYAYADSTGIKSFVVYYRTSKSEQWTSQASNSFNTRVPGKFYVEIGADRFLNSTYIEYYLEAQNTFRTAVTPVHRVTVLRSNDFTGLRSNLSEGDTVSGIVDIVGRAGDDAAVNISIDGAAVDSTRRLEQGAYFTMDISGLDGRKNAITANGELVQIFSRWYDVLPSRAVMIDNSLFAYNQNGDAEVAIRILAGTEIDALDISSGTASDNFSLTNFFLALPDGTVLHPDGSVTATDKVTLGSSKREVELHFTVPKESLNANGTVWNTKLFADGSHTITIASGDTGKDLHVNVDNTAPAIGADVPEHINGVYTFQPIYTDASEISPDTLTLELDGAPLNGTSFNGSMLSPGAHTLTASVQDVLGNTGTGSWTFSSSLNYPVFSNVSSSDVDADSATLTAVLSGGDGAAISFHKAQALTVDNGITVYQGYGDSTANAQPGALGTVTSENGSLPYQMYAFDVKDADTSLRVSLEAGTDYGKDVRLYVRSSAADRWIPLRSTYEDGKVASVFETGDYITNGKVYVLAQGRGMEMAPGTAGSRAGTVANDYVWDGTGEPEQYDFSIAWESDTQYYTQSYPANFEILNNYIAGNKDRMDIRYVVHTGDIVDDIDEIYQWEYADQYMRILENAGLPYGVLAGNHDIANHNARYQNYQTYFGADRFRENSSYGGSYKNNIGHYDLVTAGGQDLIFVYMSYDFDQEAVAWINKVLLEHADRIAILGFHNYVNANGELDTAGLYFQNEVVSKNSNVALVLGGHYHGAAINIAAFDDDGDGIKERKVYQIVTDYQSGVEGGNAYYKPLYFDLANGKIYMNSYSPRLNDYNYYDTPKLTSYGAGVKASGQDIYELSLDFDTAPKTLTVSAAEAVLYSNTALGAADADNALASVSVEKLASGTTYTWLAIAANSAGSAYSGVASFTTQEEESGGSDDGSDGGSDGSSDGGSDGSSNGSSNGNAPAAPSVESSISGNLTTVSIKLISSTDSRGKAAASIDSGAVSALADAAKAAEEAGRKAVVKITLESAEPAASAEIAIPKDSFNRLAAGTDASLVIDAGIGIVTFDGASVDAINSASSSGDIKISIAKADTSGISGELKAQVDARAVYDLTVTSGGTAISGPGGGKARISLPYSLSPGEDHNAIAVFRISDSGERQTALGKYNPGTGMVEITAAHFSKYVIGYNKVSFNDVAAAAWYQDAVTFNAARGITDGTGNGGFSPDAPLTRGQFLVMLMRAYGIAAEEKSTDNFADAGNTYYTNYLAAAKRLGIASGVGDNQFAPDGQITRQDMFTLLYRVLETLSELPETAGSQTAEDFADAGQIAGYAKTAISALIKAGIISGSGEGLNPAGTATRAEMVQTLYNLLSI